VAVLAGLRESRLNVVGIGRTLEVRQVAGNASRVRQVVVAVEVALGAWGRYVCPGQRETRFRMIETCVRPGSCVVTVCAGGWNARLRVVGIGCALIVRHVARSAIRWSSREPAIDMAP